jgi:hypothetical protein
MIWEGKRVQTNLWEKLCFLESEKNIHVLCTQCAHSNVSAFTLFKNLNIVYICNKIVLEMTKLCEL